MSKIFTYAKALSVRLIFFVYCFIATWRVVATYGNSAFWWMLFLIVGILFEMFITFYRREGKEWKWFSPAIFFFLVSALPCIWLLELHLLAHRHKEEAAIANSTAENVTNNLLGLQLQVDLDEFGWALALEQTMFCLLILSRWALPRGEVSRNQLSQLLLVHVGMAADIMELFEVFEEPKIVEHSHLVYPLLTLWTISLLQYCMVITSTAARKDRFGGTEEGGEAVDGDEAKCTCHIGDWDADVVGILTTILMQDLPFFIFRTYLLGGIQMISHMMVFFTCKNALVIVLQVYRLVTIYLDYKNGENEPEVISNFPDSSEPDMRVGNNRIVPTPQKLDPETGDLEPPILNGNRLTPDLGNGRPDDGLRRSKNAFEDYGSTENVAS